MPVLSVLFILFVILPYLWLSGNGLSFEKIEPHFFFSLIQNSVVQALLSAALSLFIGFFSAAGYCRFSSKIKQARLVYILLMLPSFTPPLFILIITLATFKSFPMGLFGVVILHTFINVGLSTVQIAKLFNEKLSFLATVANQLGASQVRFLIRVAMPLLKKELSTLFLFLFLVSFVSFAIPLVLGGAGFTTLEVHIYDLIFNFNQWSQALTLIFIQILLLFILIFLIPRTPIRQTKENQKNYFPYGSKIQILGAIIPTGLLFFSFIFVLPSAWQTVQIHYEYISHIADYLNGSFLVAMGTGIFVVFQLILFSYFYLMGGVKRFLIYYFPPSSSAIAFAFAMLSPDKPYLKIIMISLCLSWVWAPTFFRMQLASVLDRVSAHVDQGKILGASKKQIFSQIILPLILSDILFLAAMSAFWASGEFALTDILNPEDMTLAQWMKSLLDNYRVEYSLVLLLPQLLLGFICYCIFGGLGLVTRSKYQKAIR